MYPPQAGEADTAQGSAAFQRDLDRWEEWANGKLKMFKDPSLCAVTLQMQSPAPVREQPQAGNV